MNSETEHGPYQDGGQARAQWEQEVNFLPLSDAQKVTFLLRQAVLIHGGATEASVYEMNDDQPVMQALSALSPEVATVIAGWIWRASDYGINFGRGEALKELRRRYQPSHPNAAVQPRDLAVIRDINELLRAYDIPLRP